MEYRPIVHSNIYLQTTDFSMQYGGVRRQHYQRNVAFFLMYASLEQGERLFYAYNLPGKASCETCPSNEDDWECECFSAVTMEEIFSEVIMHI